LSWRSGIEVKNMSLQNAIKDKIVSCSATIPVFALGGGEIEPLPPNADEADGLEKLWEFLECADSLDTSQLQPFEGADVKWQKMIDARDDAEAKAKAALIYVAVMLKLGMLSATLFWRHAMLPSWLSLLLLNLPGVIDEFLILAIFVYWVGPYDVAYSMQHFYLTWVQPKAQPYIEMVKPMIGAVSAETKKKEE